MASNEPPDKPGRPPISELDVPIDDSGAEEVEKKREQRQNPLPVAAVEALKLRGLGFTILPIETNTKEPLRGQPWERQVRNNPAVFLTNEGTHNYAVLPPPNCFGLDVDKSAPEKLAVITDSLGVTLPDTLMTFSPNGRHQFYRWPENKPRPSGNMFGTIVTRWPFGDKGQGFLLGPGSVVVQDDGTLGTYTMFGYEGEDQPIADFPPEWVEAALAWRPAREVRPSSGPLAEPTAHYELPESVEAGNRYTSILAYTAHLYNRGLSSNEMWPLVQAELAPKFDEKLTLTELRSRFERAVRAIAPRLGEPKAVRSVTDFLPVKAEGPVSGASGPSESDTPSQVPLVPPLLVTYSVRIDELESADPTSWCVDGWVAQGGLTWWAGQPKSMKSLGVLQMLGAFVAGDDWMEKGTPDNDTTRLGLYLTKEGTPYETLQRLTELQTRHGKARLGDRLRVGYVADVSFDAAGHDRMMAALAELESELSVTGKPLAGILVIDPMRDFMLPGWDENEAKTIALVKAWCRSVLATFPWLAIILVHHLRKSAGHDGGDGLDMSGSGAGYAAGDATINWWAKRDFGNDDDDEEEESEALAQVKMRFGGYKVEQRGAVSFKGRWSFNPIGRLLSRDHGVRMVPTMSGGVRAMSGDRTKVVIDALRAAESTGLTVVEIAEVTGIDGVKTVRTLLYRARGRGDCSYVHGRWFAEGFSPGVAPDGLLPPVADASEEAAPAADEGPDDESWTDPIHKV